MYIFNASKSERRFLRTDGSQVVVGTIKENKAVSGLELADPKLIDQVYKTAMGADGKFELGLIAGDEWEKDKIDSVVGRPVEGFIFQSAEQAKAVLAEGKDFSIEETSNIQVGYEIKFDGLKKELAEKDAAITELKAKIEHFKRHEATYLDKIEAQAAEITAANSKAEQAENKLSAARQELAEKELALNQARSAAQTYKTQAEHKQADINAVNTTLAAARKNCDDMRESAAKVSRILTDLKVFYGLQEVQPGVWRIPQGQNETENTMRLDKLVSRLGLILRDGEYFLPSEIESAVAEPETSRKKKNV